jgi:hypothetical protein
MSTVLANNWTFDRLRALEGPQRDAEVASAQKRKRKRVNGLPDAGIDLKRQKQKHLLAKVAGVQKKRANKTKRLAKIEAIVAVRDAATLKTQLAACGGVTKQKAFLKLQINSHWHNHRPDGKKTPVYMFSQNKINFTLDQLFSNLKQLSPLSISCSRLS